MHDPVSTSSSVEILLHDTRDVAPEIFRQRLVVEGTVDAPIDASAITEYLTGLSRVCHMKVLLEPVTHKSEQYGWAGWVHWDASGAHFYAWERPRLFFSVDIYTCRAFDADEVVAFTREFFGPTELVALQF